MLRGFVLRMTGVPSIKLVAGVKFRKTGSPSRKASSNPPILNNNSLSSQHHKSLYPQSHNYNLKLLVKVHHQAGSARVKQSPLKTQVS
jgi:hypothetical protein